MWKTLKWPETLGLFEPRLVDNRVDNFFLWITLPVTLKDSVLVGVAVYGVAIER